MKLEALPREEIKNKVEKLRSIKHKIKNKKKITRKYAIDIKDHIQAKYPSIEAYAASVSTSQKKVSGQKVSLWIKAGYKWIDGDVWKNVTKFKEK